MRWSRSAALVSLALGLMPLAHARTPTAPVAGYGERLEAALNQGDAEAFQRLVAPSLQGRLQRRYQRLTAAFPGALWNVDRLEPMADGRSRLRVSVKGVGRSNGLMYRLQASQTLAVQLEAGVMQEEEVVVLGEGMRRGLFDDGDLEFFTDEALKEAGIERAISRARMLRRIRDHFKP